MNLPATKLRILHVARRQLGMDDAIYRAMLTSIAGVTSARDLSADGFDLVMEHMTRLGFKSTSKRKPLAVRIGRASPHQVQLIRHLWWEVTRGEGTEAGLGHWLERHSKVSSVAFVTAAQAPKVIAALKAWKAKPAKEAAA